MKLVWNYKTIKTTDYIENFCDAPKFIEYCKKCNKYNKMWTCPPYPFDTLEKISSFTYVNVIGTKIEIAEDLLEKTYNHESIRSVSYEIIRNARDIIDNKLIDMEKNISGSLAFFAGSCQICTECARVKGEECINPEKLRYTLEAFGFDIGKTAPKLFNVELKWGTVEKLPEYFFLVSALFSNNLIKLNEN